MSELSPELEREVFHKVFPRQNQESFVLYRTEDLIGVSGTGIVAEGVQFSDGIVVIRWIVGEYKSTVVWPSIEAVEKIHGHDGRTVVYWLRTEPS